MGNKKRKNSNYVTEKTLKAKAELERVEKRKKIAIIASISAAIAIAVAMLIVGIVFAIRSSGDDEVSLTVTHHASLTVEWKDGENTRTDEIHIELYGEEAPITVANFVKLAGEGYYNELYLDKLIKNYYIAGGNEGAATDSIKGEFSENGVENKIPHKLGTIYMLHDEYDNDSATAGFMISLTKNYKEYFEGKFAAFGRVVGGMDILLKFANDRNPLEEGWLLPVEQAKIKSITVHEPH